MLLRWLHIIASQECTKRAVEALSGFFFCAQPRFRNRGTWKYYKLFNKHTSEKILKGGCLTLPEELTFLKKTIILSIHRPLPLPVSIMFLPNRHLYQPSSRSTRPHSETVPPIGVGKMLVMGGGLVPSLFNKVFAEGHSAEAGDKMKVQRRGTRWRRNGRDAATNRLTALNA